MMVCCGRLRLRGCGPSFQRSHETKELAPQREVMKNAARLEKTSHAGIIRIGFEGISQPHNSWSTPVSIIRLRDPTVQVATAMVPLGEFGQAICKIDARPSLLCHLFEFRRNSRAERRN